MVEIDINPRECNGCGTCADVCPVGVFEMKDDKSVAVNVDECPICNPCETQRSNAQMMLSESSNSHVFAHDFWLVST